MTAAERQERNQPGKLGRKPRSCVSIYESVNPRRKMRLSTGYRRSFGEGVQVKEQSETIQSSDPLATGVAEGAGIVRKELVAQERFIRFPDVLLVLEVARSICSVPIRNAKQQCCFGYWMNAQIPHIYPSFIHLVPSQMQ
ncbi:hypothetical protein CSKR_105712 [Clonorchis sinensis]|uniref:Uncharacterized protein n=1 Tax=Clonorchis sinensis TaxID=79923 RepID=A0A3R7K0N9_CLOSI|nr:hypothetical protein CSKR_105712 [Clonorchis sinensis]